MQPLPSSSDCQAVPSPLLRPLPSHSSSLSGEMWSRGSIYEKEVTVAVAGPVVPVPAVDKAESLYLYDCGGVVVYDSKAAVGPEACPGLCSKPELRKKEFDLTCEADKKKFLSWPAYPPFPAFSPAFPLTVPADVLCFDSRFESGNLKKAVRRQDGEYWLLLQEDTETKGHTQWFFFSVTCRKPGPYRFHLANLCKSRSLYTEGMQPAVKSAGKDWARGGFDVKYEENAFQWSNQSCRKAFSLSFSYEFLYENELISFAHAVPYTYTDLNSWLSQIQTRNSDIARVNPLCQTLAGNICPVLTITQAVKTYKSFQCEGVEGSLTTAGRKLMRARADLDPVHSKKKGLVLTARVHPGETAGSFMLQGAVDFLLSSQAEAVFLRSQYVIKVVPMLNPDGVRYGNSRCSLLGVDLNRRWRNPSRYMHPTIYFTKRMMQVFSESHEISLFCDFHAHSSRRNAFMYGCTQSFLQLADRKANLMAKMVPLLLCERNSALAWSHCSFRQDRLKEATARLVVYNELQVVNSYTLEASFYGPDWTDRADLQFCVADYEGIGKDLMCVSAGLANKAGFFRNLTHIRDLLRTLEASQQLEKCKSAANIRSEKISPSKAQNNARFSLGQYGPESKESEEYGSELAEKRLWEAVLEYEGKIETGNVCEDSDSSGSESGEEERKGVLIGKNAKRVENKGIERKLPLRNRPDLPLKEREKTLNRLNPLITPPKLYRSNRSPLLSSNRTPLRIHHYGEMQARSRAEDLPTASPSSSSTLLSSCFEPLVIVTDPGIRSLGSFNRAGKGTGKGPIRVASVMRYRGSEQSGGLKSRKSAQETEAAERRTVGRRSGVRR